VCDKDPGKCTRSRVTMFCSTCRRTRSCQFFASSSSIKTCKPCLERHRIQQKLRRTRGGVNFRDQTAGLLECMKLVFATQNCSSCKCVKEVSEFRSGNRTCETCLFKRRVNVVLNGDSREFKLACDILREYSTAFRRSAPALR